MTANVSKAYSCGTITATRYAFRRRRVAGMGCSFCASTIAGLSRHLTASEILGQILAAEKDSGERISNIVMMGIGEPLDNYDNTLRFLRLVNLPEGRNIGYRHISLSTCGLADRIKMLAKEDMPITLSVSLHAPNQKMRAEMMPVAKKWHIDELIGACREYIGVTGRRISFEYAMIDGVNDTRECADELVPSSLRNALPRKSHTAQQRCRKELPQKLGKAH